MLRSSSPLLWRLPLLLLCAAAVAAADSNATASSMNNVALDSATIVQDIAGAAVTSLQAALSSAGLNLTATSMAATAAATSALSPAALAAFAAQVKAACPSLTGVTKADLPLTRPPVWPNTCGLNCLQSVRVVANDDTDGVLEVDAIFKPIKNVTAAMMTWMLDNLSRNIRHPVNNKTYPMYLVFQPTDHLHHAKSPANATIRTGSRLTWVEMPLTGCSYVRASAAAPFACPQARVGFVQADPPTAYVHSLITKVSGPLAMTVRWFNATGIEFVSKVNLLGASRVIGKTRHSWADTAAGLSLRTRLFVGLMANETSDAFDGSLLARIANKHVGRTYMGGTWSSHPLPVGNATAAAYAAAHHFASEYGTTPRWLPGVYAKRASVFV